MAESRYGRNRLQSGFVAARRIQRSASHPGTPEDSEDDSSPLDASHPGVHDLDTTDDDGGMILNVDGSGEEPIVISDDETEDGESDEGQRHARSVNIDNTSEEEESNTAHKPAQSEEKEDEPSFVIDLTPGMPQICLKDLNPDQLQDQIKYAFWHLQRDEIDLSRPLRGTLTKVVRKRPALIVACLLSTCLSSVPLSNDVLHAENVVMITATA
ncbi:hypothetical protein LTS08_004897 [Lithohypha guttulata]|uniref:Uncharacterized protein n=1 Tax=Lithohypha guttulata TaxID=1690604 RepID=A0AAN7T1Y6_9EURO|nr:hypothetical protein LTR51_005302 [Lithohypha guttulata]KAK5088042.1 hypothetical protein LTR05_002258 [Lithohypha guttulata]KAK5101290.1 hypothetical protein LTS08_004897 [Lithohypha guttulata]